MNSTYRSPQTDQLPLGDRSSPLVSVLVRTMGRPSLIPALESVQAQSFGDWELVVVNASGVPFATLPEHLVSAVRLLNPGVALDRAAAANALLDAVRGKYAIFLDDDDWLLPPHLGKLVDALDAAPELVAAYSDVECVTSAGTAQEKRAHIFAQDFDAAALQLQNYLPIHAVLFRVDCMRQMPPARFDPALDLFEDWDFWLQLCAKGPFKRVPGISAVYALSSDAGSGHADADSARRRAMLNALARRQMERWRPVDVTSLIERDIALSNELAQKRQSVEMLEQRAVALGQAVDSLVEQNTAHQREMRLQQAEIQKLGRVREQQLKALEDKQKELNGIYNSSSWRLTRPLRAARRYATAFARRVPLRLIPNTLRAVRGGIARHGMIGFVLRAPEYLRSRRTYLAMLRARSPAADVHKFSATVPTLNDIRLHPDLTGVGVEIDAKVSVVIPTLNAGLEFSWMLRKLRAQRGVREIEIVIVDSGSKDQTVPFSRDAGAKVIEILPSEFSHSYARNLGADNATGDYVLFMVQDAYPIGDQWMHGMLRFLQDHAQDKLMAVSCAEFSRSDSDMMYDSMINTHYKFLGCLEYDRIGQWRGDDHMALRSHGQLSDVSCLISRDCFLKYRYQGDYAEDLDLGIRLIKDGFHVAMLASVKVVHSHNRAAYYYLKRSFVDVIFLVGLFDDFSYAHCTSLTGLLAGVQSTAAHLSNWLNELRQDVAGKTLGEELDDWILGARTVFAELRLGQPVHLGDERLDAFVNTAAQRYLGADALVLDAGAREEARRFSDSFIGRLEHFNQFAREVYGQQDALLRKELADVVRKTFGAAAGSALAFYCLDHMGEKNNMQETARAIHTELTAGI